MEHPRNNSNRYDVVKLKEVLEKIVDSDSPSARETLFSMNVDSEDLAEAVKYLNDYKHLYLVEKGERKRLKEGIKNLVSRSSDNYKPDGLNEINDFLAEF